MVFAEGTLTFKKFAVKEPLPLATVQEAVLEFLQGRDDAVVYGAQAVNAYVDEPRMTQDVDIPLNACSGACRRASRLPARSVPDIGAPENHQGRSGFPPVPSAQAEESPSGGCPARRAVAAIETDCTSTRNDPGSPDRLEGGCSPSAARKTEGRYGLARRCDAPPGLSSAEEAPWAGHETPRRIFRGQRGHGRLEGSRVAGAERRGRRRGVLVYRPQHFLYFFPLPQGHGWLRPIFGPVRIGSMPCSGTKWSSSWWWWW